MKVICISGKAGIGKDTTAKILKEILETEGQSVLITHYADLVKYICEKFFGWNGVKDVHGRALLQTVGTDIVRAQNPDFWVGFIASVLKLFEGEWGWVLIPDTRFPNEIDFLKMVGFDVTHLRMLRSDFITELTEEQLLHESETALDLTIPDYYIDNCGAEAELRMNIARWLAEFNKTGNVNV